MNQWDYAADLGALGYPGYSYVKGLSTAGPGVAAQRAKRARP